MLVVTGDEDWPCLVPNLYLKRVCTSAALLVLPNSGHAVNLEEPGLFNAALADLFGPSRCRALARARSTCHQPEYYRNDAGSR
jgi:pimeloyl-ACP methyl ester carboxylesterase